MTAKDIVAELKKLGTEQTKKMWMTHCAQAPCFGSAASAKTAK